VSEAQYFFTNILSAESFIWNIDAESLSMDERDFQKKIDLARERLLGLSVGSENQDTETSLDVREHRTQTLTGSGSSDVNLSLKDHVQGPVQDKRRESDVSSKSVEQVQSISDLEKKGATELLKDDDLNKIFQEYPFLFARAGDLTVADVDSLLNSYKQLVLRYVALSQGMGVTPETPLVQSMQTTSDLQISEEPENVKNVVNSCESSEESSKASEEIKNEILNSEVSNVSTQQASVDPSGDQRRLEDESSEQPEHE
jgi:hypothetical protein